MALMDEEDIEYRKDEEDEFSMLASELFPDADPDKVKRLIEICVEDRERKKDGGKGEALIIGIGGPPKKK